MRSLPMTSSERMKPGSLLLLTAGAKGAIGTTLAVALAAMRRNPDSVLPSLTTGNMFPFLPPPQAVQMTGWDTSRKSFPEAIERHGVLPEHLWKPYQAILQETPVLEAPSSDMDLKAQVERLMQDIQNLREQYPEARPVFINLLPAACQTALTRCKDLSQLYSEADTHQFPDISYALAAILSGIPVANFTPNELEIPVLLQEAERRGVPLSGRDGKTGQTYFKVVLASALKARSLFVDGWYSLNILGNADGANLMDPERACGKLTNKTELLDDILGYRVGERYGAPSHKVHIDYYPPRGDAKEAWDVIDFQGIFGLPMSIRLNLQGRDSILAAPLVLDLSRWMAALHMAGRSGPIPELAFYFKKPVGDAPPLDFQDQWGVLRNLERECEAKLSTP